MKETDAARYPKNVRYLIEGIWSGYRAGQERVCYREVAITKQFADSVMRLNSIQFTDGTFLYLSVRPLRARERFELRTNYRQLVFDCVRHNVGSVLELAAIQREIK